MHETFAQVEIYLAGVDLEDGMASAVDPIHCDRALTPSYSHEPYGMSTGRVSNDEPFRYTGHEDNEAQKSLLLSCGALFTAIAKTHQPGSERLAR